MQFSIHSATPANGHQQNRNGDRVPFGCSSRLLPDKNRNETNEPYMGATLFSPRCQGNLKDAPLSHPLSFVRSAACTTFSVASCTITHMEDKHASIHMHLFTWKMHRKILEYHDGAVPEIEAWVAHHVAIPRPNSGVYACVPFKPAPPQTRCCPIVSKYLSSIAQCASKNMVLSAKDLDYHSQHILITCHACIICIKTCLGTRRKQELELEGGWFLVERAYS